MKKAKEIVPITNEDSLFQKKILKAVAFKYPNLLKESDQEKLKKWDETEVDQKELNQMFQVYINKMYETHYSKVELDLKPVSAEQYKKLKKAATTLFQKKWDNEYTRVYYQSYLIDTYMFLQYLATDDIYTFAEIRAKLEQRLESFWEFMSNDRRFDSLNKNKILMNIKTLMQNT